MRKCCLLGLIVLLTLFTDVARKPVGWCCLCMCHARYEDLCSPMCLRLQHGTRIVEEPEMQTCTQTCLRFGVVQIFPKEMK